MNSWPIGQHHTNLNVMKLLTDVVEFLVPVNLHMQCTFVIKNA